jgi:hypothetical protein
MGTTNEARILGINVKPEYRKDAGRKSLDDIVLVVALAVEV